MPLGSYRVFDPSGDLTELSTYGTLGGTFSDGLPWYAGYGDNNGCIGQNICPVLLTNNPANPGGFITCGGGHYKVGNLFYVIDHPNLVWVETNNTDMTSNLPNALKITGNKYVFLFGRVVEGNVSYPAKVHNGVGGITGEF